MTHPIGQPIDRKCPTCHAPPGQPCITPKGRTPKTKPHSMRTPPLARGRNTVINPDLTEYISTALANGVPIQAAVTAAGIGTTTFYRWITEADNTNNPNAHKYREFRDEITRARARGQVELAEMIRDHATRRLKSEKVAREPDGRAVRDSDGSIVKERVWESDWRAASFILERSHPKPWGRRESVEVSSSDGLGVAPEPGQEVLVQPLSEDQYAGIVQGLANWRERKELEAGQVVEGEIVESQGAG